MKKIVLRGAFAAVLPLSILLTSCSDKDNILPLLPADQVVTADSANTGNTTSTPTATTTSGDFDIVIPSGGDLVQGSTPEGDFSGVTFTGDSDNELAGFVSITHDHGQGSCTDMGTAVITAINATSLVSTAAVTSNSTVNTAGASCSVIYLLAVTTGSSTTVTGLSNALIEAVGTTTSGGSVTSLPSGSGGESTSTSFVVNVQVTYSSGGDELIGVGVSTTANYGSNEGALTGFLDGTNVGPSGTSQVAGSTNLTGSAPPKADFLWVVDNSGSMGGEQSSVVSNAGAFFDKLSVKNLDFKLGVITTDNATLRGTGFTSTKTQFETDVAAGTGGSGLESGIYHAELALTAGGSVVNAGYPRSGASLTVIILSDEADYYQCYSGGSAVSGHYNTAPPCTGGTVFDQADNVFKNNNYKVFAMIGLNTSTGQPGTCSDAASGTSANGGNNTHAEYYNLASNTGGSSSTICSSDYSQALDAIVNQAAASSSSYTLTHTPISSSIAVTVNGSAVAKSTSNGWSYNSSTNTIVFSGAAQPAQGAAIVVSYNYFDTGLAGFLLRGSNTSNSVLLAGAILLFSMMGLLVIRAWRKREA